MTRDDMWGRVCVTGLCTVFLAGCLTRDALYDELLETRDAAYDAWLRLREDGDIPVPAENLSLDEAVRIALLYNKSLQAKIQEREVARGQLVSAHQLALPRVDATASTAYGSRDTDSANISFRQPLFRGGGATATLRAAKLFAFWSDESVRDTIQTVIKQVTTAYYTALLADNLCQVNRDAVVSAEAHLSDVRVKRVNGVASKYDELRAQVDVANFRAELIRQENNLVLAKTSLLRTLGTATDAPLALADQLLHAPVKTTLEEAIETAYANRPDLYMAELNIRMQREQVRALQGTYLPEIDLAFSAGTDRARDGDDEWAGTQRAALELNWSIFDGFGREGELIAAKAKLRQREIELKSVEEDVFLDVQQALLNLKNAEEYVESQRLNLQHAEEGLRLAMTGYREGVNTEVEVVDARSSLTEARGNHYRALFDHCMARLSLEQATGLLGKNMEGK
ncbi:MAG TPA: TolC family protein [Kiritimatiellia bacterium]|nr:TolC family protein [Kiritimatiellia bacterium]